MSLNIGRKGKLFIKKEVSYGTVLVLAAANAMRHIDLGFSYDPYGRETSKEKKQSPGPVSRFDRRVVAGFDLRSALLRPSGTINTLPECDPILEAAFGTKTNVALATTVNDGAATTTSATLTSVVGLAAKGAILITCPDAKKRARIIVSVVGSVVTWAPALPAAPADTAAVKSCLIYQLTTDNAVSLVAAHYLPGFTREVRGIGIDKLNLKFDANEEPMLSASGPAQKQITAAQSEPGSFTTVGGNPPSGLTGELRIGSTAYLFKRAEYDLTNGIIVRNVEYGNDGLATEVYRSGRREIAISLETFAETEATLYDLTEAGTNVTMHKQTGYTEGNIVAVWCPRVEFKVPDTSDEDEAVNWSFRGMALESVDGANDEMYLILA